ncbi:MAG: hypothetical protein IPK26_23015 [Planctomycetes bacterium]|nr:hypothetical protein [Planctomycetota bacterium]
MRSSLLWSCAVGCWSGCVTAPPQTVVCALDDDLTSLDPELTRVVAIREIADTRCNAAACERITDAAGWGRLRAEAADAMTLPDDWCDFRRDCVLLVAFGPGSGRATTHPTVATEEGVDVITLTCDLAAPADDRQSPGVALVVPRRDRSTAVVLRRLCGHVPVDETTLRVFEPLH